MENSPLNRRTSDEGTTLNSQVPPENDDDLEDAALEDADENKAPPAPSWRDFKDYFWHKGNIRTLAATSLCWFLVDL
jgi:PHS family inorganic phosphate transporter-like MFS transporter